LVNRFIERDKTAFNTLQGSNGGDQLRARCEEESSVEFHWLRILGNTIVTCSFLVDKVACDALDTFISERLGENTILIDDSHDRTGHNIGVSGSRLLEILLKCVHWDKTEEGNLDEVTAAICVEALGYFVLPMLRLS
jgi:hypothetical protein